MRRSRRFRIQRKRKQQRHKTMTAILQSSLLISSLLIYSTKQIGTTYGEFNSTQDAEGYLQTCRVFPGKIEELLSTVSGHLELAAVHKAKIAPITVTWQVYGNPAVAYELDPVPPSVTDNVYSVTDNVYGEESGALSPTVTDDVYGSGGRGGHSDRWEQQLSELASQLQALQLQFDANQLALNLITSEITEGDRQLHELLLMLEDLHSNCAEIGNIWLLDELSRLSKQELLSLSMQQQIDAAVFYLRKVSESGLRAESSSSPISNQVSSITFLKPEASGEPLNRTAFHQYIELQDSIEEIISGLRRTIASLESSRSIPSEQSTAAGSTEQAAESAEQVDTELEIGDSEVTSDEA